MIKQLMSNNSVAIKPLSRGSPWACFSFCLTPQGSLPRLIGPDPFSLYFRKRMIRQRLKLSEDFLI